MFVIHTQNSGDDFLEVSPRPGGPGACLCNLDRTRVPSYTG